MTNPITKFRRLGEKASYHFADDSGKEWDLAYKAQREAIEVFDAHPESHETMREIARDFLWAGEFKRQRPAPQSDTVKP